MKSTRRKFITLQLGLFSGAASARDFFFKELRIYRNEGGGLKVRSLLELELDEELLSLLKTGVPIFFNYELALVKTRWYWTASTLFSKKIAARVRYLSLQNKWRINVYFDEVIDNGLNDGLGLVLADANSVRRYLMNAGFWELGEEFALDPTAQWKVSFELDRKNLPRTLAVSLLGTADYKYRCVDFFDVRGGIVRLP